MEKPHFSKEPYAILGGSAGGGAGGGMRFHSGAGEPDSSVGQPGDIYLNTSNGDLYSNVNGEWTFEMNLRGPQGEQGPQGEPGPQGEQGPQGPPGADGFGTEEQYNEIIARLEALESAVE